MTWWFRALCVDRSDVLEDFLMCEEARPTQFAGQFLGMAVDRAISSIGVSALRAEFGRRVALNRHASSDKALAALEVSIEILQLFDDLPTRVKLTIEWSTKTLAETVDVFENGLKPEGKQPTSAEFHEETMKIVDIVRKWTWEP